MKAYIACSIFLLPVLLSGEALPPAHYLSERIPEENGRYKTFHSALKLMKKRNVQTIVETGTERWQDSNYCFDGDGGSTIIFANWAKDNGAKMFSVDIDPTHIKYAANNTKEYVDNLSLVLSDSVAFLQNFPTKIDFLYLDSYDYDEKNPDPAQQHCLREIIAAEDKLSPDSIIMIDDCNIPGGGKGYLAIQYLLSRGWFLYKNFHQVILINSRYA